MLRRSDLTMSSSDWIDKELSERLSILRDTGEGQHLEFMQSYPSNGFELSREIAAFASSNAGTILIGVSDDGELIGLPEAHTSAGRDALCQRIEGVCSGHVRPAITPVVKFAEEGGRIVLIIEVPRGKQPVYYSKHTPYVRHLSRSRPAEPHEVVERIEEWSKGRPVAAPAVPTQPVVDRAEAARTEFLTELATVLIDVLVYGEELEKRHVNPWLNLLRTQLQSAGQQLRHLAAEQIASELNLEKPMLEIADLLDHFAAHRLALGSESWRTLTEFLTQAITKVRELKSEKIDRYQLSSESLREIRTLLSKFGRQLAELSRRADSMAEDGRIQDVMNEASQIGYNLLRLSYYQLDGISDKLRPLARGLHLLETERLYIDGGASMRRILENLHSLARDIQTLLSEWKPERLE
jgi:ATP-dependent DNA helicase RecG